MISLILTQVEDPKAGCKTYKCLPIEAQKPDRCHEAEKELIDGKSVVMLDECGNPRIIKKCPVPVEMLNGCPERKRSILYSIAHTLDSEIRPEKIRAGE